MIILCLSTKTRKSLKKLGFLGRTDDSSVGHQEGAGLVNQNSVKMIKKVKEVQITIRKTKASPKCLPRNYKPRLLMLHFLSIST